MSESFDRALRSAARRGRPAGVCPDAASLAAYADNGLTADERRRVEAHAADCATCLEHLALLGAISLDREAPEPSRSWLVRWGWLVPVATAVLVVAVWVRLPEQKASEEAGPAAARTPAVAPAAPGREVAASSDMAAEQPTAERDARDQTRQRRAARTAQTAPANSAAPLEKKVDALAPVERRDQERQELAATSPVPPAAPQAPGAAPPAPAAVQAQKAGEENLRRQRLGAASKVAQPAAAAAPALADAMKEEVRTEPAPPPESYRALGSRIEQSKDGGTTWRTALSDPQTTFTIVGCAGGQCWIGTADGRILRATPDGFSRSVLPLRARVVAITSGGSQAAVVTVEGGQQFRTSDGGATWTLVR
jgi:hypothetical protein